jgi:hypothetical protein
MAGWIGNLGVPLRMIVNRILENGRWREELKCGHTRLSYNLHDHYAKYRRCLECKEERKAKEAAMLSEPLGGDWRHPYRLSDTIDVLYETDDSIMLCKGCYDECAKECALLEE